MKYLSLIIVFATLLGGGLKAQGKMSFNHGPYIQELTTDGVTVVFTTDKNALSWVEVKDADGNVRKVFTEHRGLKEANNMRNAVRVNNLKAASDYSYRLCSKEITMFHPYKVVFGDSITSPWYNVSTLNQNKGKYSFAIVSDIHDNPQKLEKILSFADMPNTDMVLACGDLLDNVMKEDQPYAVLDKAVELFATEKPLVFIRGNHETRGALARRIHEYFPRQDNELYFTYQVGSTFFIFMDCGEDKPDQHPVYAGCVTFDDYRAEQAEWLKKVVASKEFKKAKHRVVVTHIPPVGCGEDYTSVQVRKLWMPILNKAGIDLMVCGHTHEYSFFPTGKEGNQFPIVINSNSSLVKLDIDDKNIGYRVIEMKDGKELLKK